MMQAIKRIGAALFAVALAGPVFAAEPVFPTNSRLGLVPPADFVASTKFPGFENAKVNAAILLISLPVEAFANLETGFTDEALKQRGLTVEKREPIKLPDGEGFLVSGTHEASGVKQRETLMVAKLANATVYRPAGSGLAGVGCAMTALRTAREDRHRLVGRDRRRLDRVLGAAGPRRDRHVEDGIRLRFDAVSCGSRGSVGGHHQIIDRPLLPPAWLPSSDARC